MTAAPPSSLFVTWELTRRCAAQCLYCASGSGPEADTSNDLSTEEALRLVDDLADAGTQVLTIYGGDPLLRPDWREIVKAAADKDIAVTVMSNGSTVTAEVARDLAESGVASVTIGIDSHRADVHDQCRQLPGLFAKAVGAVHRLTSAGVRVVIGFRPTRLNAGDLRGVAELAYELGASAVSVLEAVPEGRGTALALTEQETDNLGAELEVLRQQMRGKLTILAAPPGVADPGPLDPDEELNCGAGVRTTHVTPEGTITPCQHVSLPLAHARRGDVGAAPIRGRAVQEALLRQVPRPASCTACSLRCH